MIAAILRAQFLSMRMGARRGAIFSLITGVIWYGFWCFAAFAAWNLAAAADAATLRFALPIALLLVCAYWQVIPVFSASMGSGLDMRKLLVYPSPHGKLFLVEVLLRFTTGIEMVMVLAGGVAGLLWNPAAGGWTSAPRLAGFALIFIWFNLLLASGTRSLLERLLSKRKVREVVVFLLLVGLMVPRLLVAAGVRTRSLGGLEALVSAPGLPWSAAARGMLGESTWLALLCLCSWTLLAGWFGRRQFERNLRYDAGAAQSTPQRAGPAASAWTERFYRFPSLVWRDPLAGIVEKELRSLARTPRFRMVFVMGFSFGLMVWLPLIIGRRAGRVPEISRHFLTIVCVYALTLMGQVSYWNCFGFDRSATQIYFAAPQPISKTLLGKNIASLVFIYLEVLILVGITLALRVSIGPGQVLETLLVIGICSIYMLALGNISSVQFPRALSPERVSQGGASSRFQALVFVLYPLALLPVFLAYLARYAFDSQVMFVLVLALAAIIGGVLYWIALESAVGAAGQRREQMLQELSRGEGPVVSD